jgi:hypothetical protein
MLGRPVHGAEASSSRAALPASGGSVVSPERERVDAPLAHFAEAQDEHELWQELRDHDASLNRALNKAPQIHSGPAWRVFRVRHCSLSLWFFPPCFFHARASPDQRSLVFIRRRQELEDHARERYGALDQMSFELRRLQE